MAAKKSKAAMLAPNAPRAGPSSGSPGNLNPNTDAARANTQQFTNKSKRKNRKAKKSAADSDANPGNAQGTRAGNLEEATKADLKKDSKDDPKLMDAHWEDKKIVPTKKSSEKPIRREPLIVNGMDRRSRESQMSGSSQTNGHANNTGNARGDGAALENNFGSYSLTLPCIRSEPNESIATEHRQDNRPSRPPPGIDNYNSRPSGYHVSRFSFSQNSSGSRQDNFAGRHVAQQPPQTGYITPEGTIFGGHIDSEGSSPTHSNPAGFHGGPPFSTYPISHTHGGPTYSPTPGWNEYSNPFHGSQEPREIVPGYRPVPRNAYGQLLCMPNNGYSYPHMAGSPSPPYAPGQGYDPYFAGTHGPYGNGNWPGHHHTNSLQHGSVQSYQEPLAVEEPQPHLVKSVGSGHSSERQSILGDSTVMNVEATPTEHRLNSGLNDVIKPVSDTSAMVQNFTLMETPVSSAGASRPSIDEIGPDRIANLYHLDGLPGQLLDAFQTGLWADYQMVLESATNKFLPIIFPIHAVVVSRSPRLNALLKTPSVNATRTIRVIAESSFHQPAAVETCLRHLYGLPILTQYQLTCLLLLSFSSNENGSLPSTSKRSQLDLALCYMVTGNFLCMPEITNRGYELAKDLINWDTLERVMEFGLDPHSFAIDVLSDRVATPNSVSQGTSYRDDGTESSTLRSDTSSMGIAGKLVIGAFEFIADNIPSNFKLDTEAHVAQMRDRIPCNPEGLRGTLLSNPRLAAVKFGDFESLNDRRPSYECTIISTIFLALPFGYLSKLFHYMKAMSVLNHNLAEEIVTERERRRIRILRARKINGDSEYKIDEVKSAEKSSLGWEESIRTDHGKSVNVTLARTWTGIDYSGTTRRRSSHVSSPHGSPRPRKS